MTLTFIIKVTFFNFAVAVGISVSLTHVGLFFSFLWLAIGKIPREDADVLNFCSKLITFWYRKYRFFAVIEKNKYYTMSRSMYKMI